MKLHCQQVVLPFIGGKGMESILVSQAAAWANGKAKGETQIENIVKDTGDVTKGSLFVAIKDS